MVIIAQGELVGNPFARNFHLYRGSKDISIGQQRQVRIVAALNEQIGEMEFRPANVVPIAVSLLLHISLARGTIFDRALQKPSLVTARKQEASSSGVDMDAVWRSREGKPNYRPPKTGGFGFKITASEIAKERKKKQQLAQNTVLYQAHP